MLDLVDSVSSVDDHKPVLVGIDNLVGFLCWGLEESECVMEHVRVLPVSVVGDKSVGVSEASGDRWELRVEVDSVPSSEFVMESVSMSSSAHDLVGIRGVA